MPTTARHFVLVPAIICSILLSACSQQRVQLGTDAEPTQKTDDEPSVELVTNKNFDSETLYSLLVAEIAIDRKRYDIALSNYGQQAPLTRDLNVVSRASQIAQALKAHESSLKLASLWLELDPTNLKVEQVLALETARKGDIDTAYTLSVKLLEQGISAPFDTIASNAIDQNYPQLERLEEGYRALVAQSPKLDTLLLGYSFLLEHNGKYEEALTTIRQAIKIKPTQLQFGFQEISILESLNNKEELVARLREWVKTHPNNAALRARYARRLADVDLNASYHQFIQLNKIAPNNLQAKLSLAIVAKQLKRYEDAEEVLAELILSGQLSSISHYHMGDVKHALKKYDEAIEHYSLVEEGKQYIDATTRAASLIAGTQSLEEAIAFLQSKRQTSSPNYLPDIAYIQSDILSRSGQFNAAEQILSEGISQFPDNIRLRYSRAMTYVRLNHIDAAEKDFVSIIDANPNHAAALNALGYTLADLTNRVDEAYIYIKRAHALTPEDPAVLDSLGWVEYKRGNLEAALNKLQEAYSLFPDQEIGAHLGEVLWVMGQYDEAKKIWKQSLERNPESKIVHQTIHRLNANIDE